MRNITLFLPILFVLNLQAQIYKSTEGTATFFSVAPLENIDATSKHLVSAINRSNKEIVFEVGIASFEFKNKKMEEDFNQDFMDTDKYPVATYKGAVNEKINWDKEGEYKVTSNGKLTIHGVEKARTDEATLVIKDGKVSISGEFKVKIADHKIKVPRILFEKIAEEVSVKFSVKYAQVSEQAAK